MCPDLNLVFENPFVFSKEIIDSLQDSFKYPALPVYALMVCVSFNSFQMLINKGVPSSVAVWKPLLEFVLKFLYHKAKPRLGNEP